MQGLLPSIVGWVACCLATQHRDAKNVGLQTAQPNLRGLLPSGESALQLYNESGLRVILE
ncbi:MAG: hypothetical protein K9L60_04135 [Methylovulum sp.]|nr:hypothetical protein [Methylovulum sp.]MCF7998324.1 hypothetical protein [Methylovulum sp.]